MENRYKHSTTRCPRCGRTLEITDYAIKTSGPRVLRWITESAACTQGCRLTEYEIRHARNVAPEPSRT